MKSSVGIPFRDTSSNGRGCYHFEINKSEVKRISAAEERKMNREKVINNVLSSSVQRLAIVDRLAVFHFSPNSKYNIFAKCNEQTRFILSGYYRRVGFFC